MNIRDNLFDRASGCNRCCSNFAVCLILIVDVISISKKLLTRKVFLHLYWLYMDRHDASKYNGNTWKVVHRLCVSTKENRNAINCLMSKNLIELFSSLNFRLPHTCMQSYDNDKYSDFESYSTQLWLNYLYCLYLSKTYVTKSEGQVKVTLNMAINISHSNR